ncbi:MAG: hypothetical protein K0Q59_1136 [Paenibacillus sp.]|jgi:hypothetical protein|nr:hypothetical protein [Paenibacillus sp.]
MIFMICAVAMYSAARSLCLVGDAGFFTFVGDNWDIYDVNNMLIKLSTTPVDSVNKCDEAMVDKGSRLARLRISF